MQKSLINGLKGPLNPRPIWIMRQAGRYLPEYHPIRAQKPDFMELCFTPQIVAELTFQPIKRFQFDGAIIFSDILTIPHALGQTVVFQPKPTLAPLNFLTLQQNLDSQKFLETLQPVYQALRLVKERLDPQTTLIGFAGSPWTVACYMAIEIEQRRLLLPLLTTAIKAHLRQQILAGAEVIQIFDSWSATCPAELQDEMLVIPAISIIESLSIEFPQIPLIYYSREVPSVIKQLQLRFPRLVFGLDHTISLNWIHENLPIQTPIQGNLDPQILIEGGEKLKETVHHILASLAGRSFVFNLGHGILPQTPLENVYDLIKWVREADV